MQQSRSEIEVQRLVANVQHLNGQLALGQALVRTQIAQLEAKDAVIEAKTATIEAKEEIIRRLNEGEVFVQSKVENQSTLKDKEELLGGALSIKPYEGKGFDVNLPMLFRELRQALKRKKPDAE